jgi:site-specific recombinase XerD
MKYSTAYIYPDFEDKIAVQDRQLKDGLITSDQYRKNCEEIITWALSIKKWYIAYRYEDPVTFERERFKVYEDINLQPLNTKVEFAKRLKDAVNLSLKAGYDPYAEAARVKEKAKKVAEGDRSDYTMMQAMQYFITIKKKNKLKKSTIDRYNTGLNDFKRWLNKRGMLLIKASEVKAQHILDCLEEGRKKEKWEGKTYNNHLTNMHVLFNLLAKKIHGVVKENPIEGAETEKTTTKGHAAYSDKQLSHILSLVRSRKDTYMEGLILTSYYAAVRAKEEMLNLQAGNILYDRDLISLDAEGTKAGEDQYIPLDPALKKHYIALGYNTLPSDYYLFGNSGKPGTRPATKNYYSRLFSEYRDELNISQRHTLYAFKHTRAIHLAMAGVDIYAIMSLFRHKSIAQTTIYLRELGAVINREATGTGRVI